MIKTSTPNDIIRLLYEETSLEESKSIQSELLFNEEARDEYYDFDLIKKTIDKSYKNPNERVLANILNYSKSVNLLPVK